MNIIRNKSMKYKHKTYTYTEKKTPKIKHKKDKMSPHLKR